MISLYFHVPFCNKKCSYCHFYVLPNKEELKEQYLLSLRREWQLRADELAGREILSIYFGGGTPALLGARAIEEILSWIAKSSAVLSSSIEITLEANPENLHIDLLKSYHAIGINRLSIGVQSFDDQLLLKLGREHSGNAAAKAVFQAAEAGFQNISIDLMYDLPRQSLKQWHLTLKQAATLPITHLSLYNLTIEPHTTFFKYKENIQPFLPDEEISAQMYLDAISMLEVTGLKQYEISAFARNGQISLHNSGYWTGRPFLGYGPSAFSYWNKKRFRNAANQSRWSKLLIDGQFPIDFEEELEPSAMKRELFVIRLRMIEGVHLPSFESSYGPLENETQLQLKQLESEGFIQMNQERISLTSRGILFYDTVAERLI